MHSPLLRLARGLALSIALIGLALVVAARPAHAQAGYYTYTLNNVAFNTSGSGTASGYFDYNPATGEFGSFDILTSPGTFQDSMTSTGISTAGTDYNSVTGNAATDANSDLFFGSEFENDLSFGLDAPLGTTGSDSINASLEFSNFLDDARTGNTGTITVAPEASAVPELSPAAALSLLTALGAGALGLAGSKRRRASASAS